MSILEKEFLMDFSPAYLYEQNENLFTYPISQRVEFHIYKAACGLWCLARYKDGYMVKYGSLSKEVKDRLSKFIRLR